MASLLADSFDMYGSTGDLLVRWDSVNTGSAMALASSSTTAFGSGQALNLGNGGGSITKNFGSNEPTIYFSLRLKNAGALTSASWGGLTLYDGSTAQVTIRFNGDGSIGLYTGGPTGTLIVTIAGAFSANVWDSWQGKVVIGNTAGSIELRKNGANSDTYSYTGINTRGGTANNYANTMGFSTVNQFNSSGWNLDDLFLCSASGAAPNSWLGDMRGVQQLPTGSSQAQFTASGASSNWQAVANATPDDDTSYVASSTVGQEDIYTLSAIPTSYTVIAVNYYVRWKKSDAGARTAAFSVNAHGSGDTVEVSNAALSASYFDQMAFLPLDPTGAAWTPSTVNGAALGIKVAA